MMWWRFEPLEDRKLKLDDLDTDLKVDGVYEILDNDLLLVRYTRAEKDGLRVYQVITYKDRYPLYSRNRKFEDDESIFKDIAFEHTKYPEDEERLSFYKDYRIPWCEAKNKKII